ncbi:MAG: flagellar brake domain-containing protein [Halanaerobiales bacterium]|nr:flagellar brake domain-containing protein [Halanaerobiales bacterium]
MKGLSINKKLEVEIQSGTYQGEYLCKVADIIEQGIVITGLYREGAPLPVKLDQPISVYYTTNRAAYVFKSKILRRSNKPLPLLLIERPESVERIQRRDYFRLEVSGSVDLYQKEDENTEARKITEAALLDISGGGIKIELAENFAADELFYLHLKSVFNEQQLIKSSIVRKTKVNAELYNYGLEFIDISNGLREEIIQWIFAYQRENRRRGLR